MLSAITIASGSFITTSSTVLPLGRATVSSLLEEAAHSFLAHAHVSDPCTSGSSLPSGNSLPFILSGGPLFAFPIPALNRFAMGAFSPLSGQMRISSSGGLIGQYLAGLGIGSLMVQGSLHEKARATLVLAETGFRLEDTLFTPGLAGNDRIRLLRKKYGTRASLLCTSPAAEHQYPIAQLMVSAASGSSFRFSGKNGPAVALATAGISAIVFEKKTQPVLQNSRKDTTQLLARFLAAIDKSIPQIISSENENATALSEKVAYTEDLSCFRHCLECSSPCPVKKSVKERLSLFTTPSSSKGDTLNGAHGAFFAPPMPQPKDLPVPETFLADCNRLGLDRVEASSLLNAAMERQILPCDTMQASRMFIEHMEQRTPLGQEMGNGMQWFTRHYAEKGKDQPERKRPPQTSNSYRELLAALDCTGVCMGTARALATEEGMAALLGLLNAVTPGGEGTKYSKNVWTKERFLELGRDTLVRERSVTVAAAFAPFQ